MPRHLLTLGLTLAALLAACGGPPPLTTEAPRPSPTAPALEPPGESTPQPSTPRRVRLWLAPTFAPGEDTAAGALLQARLKAFQENRPDLVLEVRIKEPSGPAGLLTTLAAAHAAAPGALPDLLTLEADDLADAAARGLVLPLDDLLTAPPDRYPLAGAAAFTGPPTYGLPFAADGEVLAYLTDHYPGQPRSWNDLVNGPSPFLFPAGDPEAAFTLAQYLALGGPLEDENGRPALDPALLAEVLSFYGSAQTAGTLAPAARQYREARETWAVLQAGGAVSAVAPFRTFLEQHNPATTAAAPLPTRDGQGICLAATWGWALVTQDPERQALALDLLRWLTDPEFLGPWTEALGLLPADPAALATWSERAGGAVANQLVLVCRPLPSRGLRRAVGPALQAAVDAVLGGGVTPEAAAVQAAEAVRSP